MSKPKGWEFGCSPHSWPPPHNQRCSSLRGWNVSFKVLAGSYPGPLKQDECFTVKLTHHTQDQQQAAWMVLNNAGIFANGKRVPYTLELLSCVPVYASGDWTGR